MDAVKAAECAAGLRELADWIETNAESLRDLDLNETRLLICRSTKEEFLAMAELLDTYEQKLDRYLTLVRRFGPIAIHLFIDPAKVGSETTRMKPMTEWQLDEDVVAAALAPEAVA